MDSGRFILSAHVQQEQVHHYAHDGEAGLEHGDRAGADLVSSAEDHSDVLYGHHYDQRQQRHVFYYEEKRFDLGVAVRVSLVYRPVEQRHKDKKRSHHDQFGRVKNRVHKDRVRAENDRRDDLCR